MLQNELQFKVSSERLEELRIKLVGKTGGAEDQSSREKLEELRMNPGGEYWRS